MKFKLYTVNYQHRGGLPLHQKAQWRVDEWEELRLFAMAQKNNWICEKSCLWSVNEEFKVIGEDERGDLYYAKYWSNQDNWHGFPVSSKRDADRPPSKTLKDWVDRGYVRKKIASRIAEGKF